MSTTREAKISILADLWMDYRGEDQFKDFMEYNDLGLPLAYLISNGLVKANETAEGFVLEAFDVLLAGLNIQEDTGFETLDELLDFVVE
jgi:hypothetical protein